VHFSGPSPIPADLNARFELLSRTADQLSRILELWRAGYLILDEV
jgi:hypothetical protein